MSEQMRPELSNLGAYNVPENGCPVKLDANEAPDDFPPRLKEAVLRRLEQVSFNRYPEDLAGALTKALAGFLGVGTDCLLLGNGSDELIQLITLSQGTGRKVIIPVPTFSMYRRSALIAGAVPVEVPLTGSFELDVEAIIAAAGDEPGIVFLCNPNNPSGNCFPPEAVERIRTGTRLLVVVDEAYGDFAGRSLLPQAVDTEWLLVLRTFSKAWGLAGIRVGYAVGSAPVIAGLARVKPPYNLNALSLTAAMVAIENPRYRTEQIRETVAERERVFGRLEALPGIEVFPSEANFILFRTAGRGRWVWKELRAADIAIREYGDETYLKDCLRVSIGSPTENDGFLAALARILSMGGDAGKGGVR